MSEFNYKRIRISGTLTLQSDMHIGSGQIEHHFDTTVTETDKRKGQHGNEKGVHSPVLLDGQGNPYIPASTLRGSLRSRLGDVADELLGALDKASIVQLDNALLKSTGQPKWQPNDKTVEGYTLKPATRLQQHVSINPVTGTAEAHHLFASEQVMAGSQFTVNLELRDASAEQLGQLLQALNGWDGTPQSAIGGDLTDGLGCVVWSTVKIDGLSNAAISKWLQSDTPLPKADWQPIKESAFYRAGEHNPRYTLRYKLIFDGPVLIHDPYRKPTDKDKSNELLAYQNSSGQLVIPGSSIKGMVRGRARRIINTLTGQSAPQEQDSDGNMKLLPEEEHELLHQLFGKTNQAGLLRFSDAVQCGKAEEVKQTFVAIDRFTGGGIEGALYATQTLNSPELNGAISLDFNRHQQLNDSRQYAWKALILGVLRDAIEGEIQIGWGKARGYGQFRLQIENGQQSITHWGQLLKELDNRGLQSSEWVAALQQIVGKTNQQRLEEQAV